MRVADIFRHDLNREIKEIIKVDDADVEDVVQEIDDYEVTNHIHDAFVELLEQYVESIRKPTEVVNAWISGFFGSGKSSFAKVLGYILSNPNLGGTNAAEMFATKLDTTQIKVLLNTIHSQVPTLAVFVDLSSSRNVRKEGESIVLPLYRELLTQLDYARDIALAELEITLEGDGRLAEFIDAFKKVTEYDWRDRRDKALALNEASRTLHELDSKTFPAADSYARTRPDPVVDANWFAKRSLDLLERRQFEKKRIVFVVDEVGQFVSRSVHRMLDLQGLAHALQKEDGGLWLVATGQETLDDIVGALGDKRVELARVRDRFPLSVDLLPSDIEEVVSKRVLEKNEIGDKGVRGVFDAHHNQLRANVALDSPARDSDFTGVEFARVYPLLPYQIQLFIDAVSALRAHGGAGPMVGGSNRTLIRLAHQLVKTALAEKEVGALATTPMAYDLVDEMVPTEWRGEIDQVIARHGEASVEAQVTKTVALLSNVKALKLDEKNLAVLIHPASDAESRRPEVAEGLKTLVREETLRDSEEGFRLQSFQEKNWEKTRRARELKTGDFNWLLREQHLPSMLRGLAASAKREFPVQVLYDDEKLLEGDITLRIYEGGEDQLERAVKRSRESAHENDVFLVFFRSEKTWRYAEEVFRSREIVKDAEARSLETDEARLLHEERKRHERNVRQLERSLVDDLLAGTVIFRGNKDPLEGKDLRPALSRTLADRVNDIYTRLDEFAAPVSRRDAQAILKSDDLAGLPDYLGASGLRLIKVEPDGYKVDESGPVAQFVSVVKERVEFGSEPTGKYLESYFHRPPFGAELDVVMILAAAAVRAGLVKVGQGGAWLSSRSDARFQEVFGAIPKFRAAVFRTREDLDVNVRTRVAKLLHHDLVGEKPGITTEDLAAFTRKHLEGDRESIEGLAASLVGLRLALPESVGRARQVLSRMRAEDDETLVQSLDAARADLKDGVISARQLRELIDHEDRFDLLHEARSVLGEDGQGLSPIGLKALDDGHEILRTSAYVDRFAELRGAVETIKSERETAWDQARDRLFEIVSEIKEQAGPLLDQLTEAQRPEFEEELQRITVPQEATYQQGPSREAMLASAAQLPALIDGLREQIGLAQGKNVRRASVRELFSEPVRNEDDLDALLTRIREAAEDALKDDEYFLLI